MSDRNELASPDPVLVMLAERIANEAPELTTDTEGALARIVAETLDADSIEDVLGSETSELSDYVERQLMVRAFRMQAGDFGPYAVIDAVVQDTGERATITCGAVRVLAQLYKLYRMQALPRVVEVKLARTREGFTAYYLVSPQGSRIEAGAEAD